MTIDADGINLIRAAQYLRMSTEHQRFSIDAQRTAIAEYAARRGYEIVSTYADLGKSGLSLKGRDALRTLLSDALRPERDFDAILILDVSRWGRFQDPDQAAHYEFICRQAGVQVVYCAEPFDNDASPMATIFKHLKRVMAHEYSRELSEKLYRAHLQQASLGLKQGGLTVYGFRRLLVDEHGVPKFILRRGERKALRTDRVCFSLGSAAEQDVIRYIFDLYVRQNFSLTALAAHLNEQGVPGNLGTPWRPPTVRSVLTCELTIGNYTYNRTTQKLQSPPRRNPEHLWIRAPARIEPLISVELFAEAQARLIRCKPTKLTERYLLDRLQRLLEKKGRLSVAIVDASPDLPCSSTYKKHFGTFAEALRRIGYVEPACFRGLDQVWTDEDLRRALRTLYIQHGYLSSALIDTDPFLPCIATVRRKIGDMARVYDFAGLPSKTHGQIIQEALARRSEKTRGVPQPRNKYRDGTWTDEAMIKGLRNILDRCGFISAPLIRVDPELPSTTTFIKRFGSLIRAYNAAGWLVDASDLASLRCNRRRNLRAGH
jgi:DNA invertase Pin-like site-specific DNA recombinase